MQPLTCKLLSLLLHYPDEQLLLHCRAVRSAADTLQPGDSFRTALEAFAAFLEGRPLIDLQVDYTAHFDLGAATTLNLVHHLDLAPHARGGLLSRLQGVYLSAGLKTIGEAPDYLPLLLEYLWLHPAGWDQAPLRETLAAVPKLLAGIEAVQPAYAALLKPMVGALERRGILSSPEVSRDPL